MRACTRWQARAELGARLRSKLAEILKPSKNRGDARTRKIPARVSSVNADGSVALLCWRAVPLRTAIVAALLACGTACGPGGPVVGGARGFTEIDVATARASLERDQARLVQLRDAGFSDPRVDVAEIVGPGESVPEAWIGEARPILVIAHDEPAARQLAARLLRLGAARVSVVRGGIEAWPKAQEEPDPASPTSRVGLSNPSNAKPSAREPARRIEPWQQSQK